MRCEARAISNWFAESAATWRDHNLTSASCTHASHDICDITCQELTGEQLLVALIVPECKTSRVERCALVGLASTCHKMRTALKPMLLELALLATPFTARYRVNCDAAGCGDFNSPSKIKRAIDARLDMFREQPGGKEREPDNPPVLYGVNDACVPRKAEAHYRPGEVFTGAVILTWATLAAAVDTEVCLMYSETDRFGDNHLIELLSPGWKAAVPGSMSARL